MRTQKFGYVLLALSPCVLIQKYLHAAGLGLGVLASFNITAFYPRDVYVSAVFATATWLARWLDGCLSVTRRYCNKKAKPILKLYRPSGSPVTLVSSTLRRNPIPRETPSAEALNTRRVGKNGDFQWKSPFISETVRDKPMVTMER